MNNLVCAKIMEAANLAIEHGDYLTAANLHVVLGCCHVERLNLKLGMMLCEFAKRSREELMEEINE